MNVDRGVVTLGGTVYGTSTAPLLVSMVGSIAGVVNVVDNLTCHETEGMLALA